MTILDQARQRAKDGLSLTQGEALALYERNEALEVGFAVQAAVLEDKTKEIERLQDVVESACARLRLSGSTVHGIWHRYDCPAQCSDRCGADRAVLISAGALDKDGR